MMIFRTGATTLAAAIVLSAALARPVQAQNTPAAPPANATQAQAEQEYDLSGTEEQPELANRSEVVRAVRTNYPRELRSRGVGGTVVVRFRIFATGRVDTASVTVQNASAEGFDDAAKRVVTSMRFRPAKVGGRPVTVWVMLPILFMPETSGRRLPTTPASDLPPAAGGTRP